MINLLLVTLFIALFVERRYTSKIGVLPNILILGLLAYPIWSQTPEYVQAYVAVGVLIGVHLAEARLVKAKTPRWVDSLLDYFYGLKSILGLYVSLILFGAGSVTTVIGLVFSAAFWYGGTKYLSEGFPIRIRLLLLW